MCSHGRVLSSWCGLRRIRFCSIDGAGSSSTRARKAGRRPPASVLVVWARAGKRLLAPTAGLIHGPCLVMLDQLVKRLLWRQRLVDVNRDGYAADAERRAVVRLFVCDAELPLHSLRAVLGRITQAVFIAADVQVVLLRFVSVD